MILYLFRVVSWSTIATISGMCLRTPGSTFRNGIYSPTAFVSDVSTHARLRSLCWQKQSL